MFILKPDNGEKHKKTKENVKYWRICDPVNDEIQE